MGLYTVLLVLGIIFGLVLFGIALFHYCHWRKKKSGMISFPVKYEENSVFVDLDLAKINPGNSDGQSFDVGCSSVVKSADNSGTELSAISQ